MVLEILHKICLGLIFILVTLWFFLHLLHIGSFSKQILSFSYEEISPITENIIAYQNEGNINN